MSVHSPPGPCSPNLPALFSRSRVQLSRLDKECPCALQELTLDAEPRALDLVPQGRALLGHDRLDAEVEGGRDGLQGVGTKQSDTRPSERRRKGSSRRTL